MSIIHLLRTNVGLSLKDLGMRVCKSKNKITLDQSNYILKVLEKFKMTDCKPTKTPMETGLKLDKCKDKLILVTGT